jgi:hypothetical protein
MEYLGERSPAVSPNSNSLVWTFNQSAGDFEAKRLPSGLLAQKYEALLNYKARDEQSKTLLAEAMFNALEKALRAVSSPNGRIQANEFISEVKPLFEALTKPESAPYLPARAPEAMADIVIALADRVGKVSEKDFKAASVYEGNIVPYRDNVTALGNLVMQYAKTYEGMIDQKPKPAKLSVPNNKLQT